MGDAMNRDMVTEALLPCPKCGNGVFLVGGYEIWCRTDCCVRFLIASGTQAELIAAWNTRASPATVALQEGQVCGQDIAPAGWWCSRAAGHDGPCAAHEKTEANPLLIAEGALRTARFAILRQCDTFKAENEITTALWHIRAALSAPKEGTHA